MKEPVIIAEGTCAYAVQTKAGYDVVVHSANCVNHVIAGQVKDEATARRVCERLNKYPRQTRAFHGLL